MSYQFNNPFSAYTQQFSAVAARASTLALENAESVFGVQLKVIEKNLDATNAFFGEFAGASDLDSYKNLLPKSLQLAKDNTERLVSAGQEVFGLNLKAGEAIGQLAKAQFESATETVQATVAKAAKSARR